MNDLLKNSELITSLDNGFLTKRHPELLSSSIRAYLEYKNCHDQWVQSGRTLNIVALGSKLRQAENELKERLYQLGYQIVEDFVRVGAQDGLLSHISGKKDSNSKK